MRGTDEYRYLLWFDTATGARKLLDLVGDTINGKPAPMAFPKATLTAGIHSQDIDKSGRYVSFGGPGVPGNNALFWDTATDTFTPQTTLWSGHACLGWGTQISQSGVQVAGTSDARGFTLRSLDSVNANLKQLVAPPPPAPYSWDYNGHWSCGIAAPGAPVIGTFYRENQARPWGLWDGEILGVCVDCPQSTVWRFAHHHAVSTGNFSTAQPHGNASPNGRYFIFTSSWDNTRGTNSAGPRHDVFLLVLPLTPCSERKLSGDGLYSCSGGVLQKLQ